MAPTVILIRHAQALHIYLRNTKYSKTDHVSQNYSIPDPALTDLGYGPQCQALSQHLQQHVPLAQSVELIVVSPMHRTLQTASQGLDFLIAKGVPVMLRAEWQENSAKPCDTGSPIAEAKEKWPQFNWETVDPLYPRKEGLYEYSERGLTERGIAARRWLKNRPEKVIAVVSHSGFLRIGVSYRMYNNADFRIFDFAEGNEHDDVGGKLVEWELTEKNGGGMGLSPKGTVIPGPEDWPETRSYSALGEAAKEDPGEKL